MAFDVGFAWHEILVKNERLIIICGPEKIEIEDEFDRAAYIDYLVDRSNQKSIDPLIRQRSFGYRAFKEHVHAGRYAEAEVGLASLKRAYGQLGFDLDDPSTVLEHFHAHVKNRGLILPAPEKYPYNLAILLFLIGTFQIAYKHDFEAARQFFNAAIGISKVYRKIFQTETIFASYDVEIQSVEDWCETSLRLHGRVDDNKAPGFHSRVAGYLKGLPLRRIRREK